MRCDCKRMITKKCPDCNGLKYDPKQFELHGIEFVCLKCTGKGVVHELSKTETESIVNINEQEVQNGI